MQIVRRVWIGAAMTGVLGLPLSGHAQQPPLQSYTAVDGLAHDRVTSVLADSRGFVWFGTAHGLSRFDGSGFTNYGVSDGLPASTVNTIIEMGDGEYLVGTNGGGVGWYQPHGHADAPRFRMFSVDERVAAAGRVNVLLRDSRGRVWVGTDGGLYEQVPERASLSFSRVPLEAGDDARLQVWALAEDGFGQLWIGTSAGLSRRGRDGQMVHEAVRPVQGAARNAYSPAHVGGNEFGASTEALRRRDA